MNKEIKEMIDKIYEVIAIWEIVDRINPNYSEKINPEPVMIGDVLDWIDKKHQIECTRTEDDYKIYVGEVLTILHFWNDKRKPIEDQIKGCIECIYNLINNNE